MVDTPPLYVTNISPLHVTLILACFEISIPNSVNPGAVYISSSLILSKRSSGREEPPNALDASGKT